MKTHKQAHLRLHLSLHLRLRLRVQLRLHLSFACIALVDAVINAQKCTSNGGPDAVLEGTLHGGANVALKGAP